MKKLVPRYPLLFMIPLFLLLAGIVITLFTFNNILYYEERNVEELGKELAQQEMSQFQSNINHHFQEADLTEIKITISRMTASPLIDLIVLTDEKNTVLYSSSLKHVGSSMQQVVPDIDPELAEQIRKTLAGKIWLSPSRQNIMAYYPIILGAEPQELRPSRFGLLYVKYDLEHLKASRKYIIENQLIKFTLLNLLVFLCTGMILHFLLARRTRRLIDLANRFAEGDRSVDFALRGRDELAQIGRALASMAERLKIRESQQQALLFNIPDLAWVKDKDGRFLAVNRPLAHACGREPEELLGLTDFDIWPKEQALRYQTDDRVIMASHTSLRFEERMVNHQGVTFWVDKIKSPMFNAAGEVIGTVGMARDITDRKTAEKELRLQSAALMAAADAIVITDKNGVIEWVNPAFSELTGFTAEEVIGLNPSRLVKSGIHDRAFYKELWETLLAGEVWRGEITNRRKDGTLYVEGQTITPVKDPSGNITHFIAIKNDLTERLRLEEHIRHSQRMESIGTLAGGIAHDFNNILAVIIGYSSLLLIKAGEDEPQKNHIQSILDAADRATHLTRELLLFSRKHILDKKRGDLNLIVEKSEKFLKRVIGEDVMIEVKLHESPLPIFADSYQIEQVLMNLATNARDSMPQGGSFTITTEEVVVESDDESEYPVVNAGRYALLSATDSGIGMSEETRQRIFEPFFTTKDIGKGTGLGLAVVFGIIKQHGGGIKVSSELGQGTTFQILLPLAEQAVAPELPPTVCELHLRGSETILLAEDNEQLRELNMTILTQYGYTVITAADGVEAVQKYQEYTATVDLLLFDLIMPKMNGKEASDLIRNLQPGIKTIFASGYAPDTIREKLSFIEGLHIISKPIPTMDLLRTVREVLDEVAP